MAFIEELCQCFTEKGLPASGRLSVEAIRTKAHSFICENEDDRSFTQASEAIE
jgi:hypothetical protein